MFGWSLLDACSGTAGLEVGWPSEIIVVAVRWYLRFGLSYRDVGDLIQTRGRPFSTPLVGATQLSAPAVLPGRPSGALMRPDGEGRRVCRRPSCRVTQ